MDAAGLGLSCGLAVADICLRICALCQDLKELRHELIIFETIAMSVRKTVMNKRHGVPLSDLGTVADCGSLTYIKA